VDLPSGAAIDVLVTTGITDTADNPMVLPFRSQFTTAGDLQAPVTVIGEVYDDQRSLPLEGATIEVISASTGAVLATATSDTRGRYLLLPTETDVLVRVSMANHSSGNARPNTLWTPRQNEGPFYPIHEQADKDQPGEHQTNERGTNSQHSDSHVRSVFIPTVPSLHRSLAKWHGHEMSASTRLP